MKPATDYRIRISGILIFTLLRIGFWSSDWVEATGPVSRQAILNAIIFSFLTSLLTWELNRLLVVSFNRYYPPQKLSPRKFAREAAALVLLNTVIYSGHLGFMVIMDPGNNPHWFYLFLGLVDRLIYGLLVVVFYELLFFIQALRTARLETEELKKLNVTMQLESLKNQVKPHFLFNSLNTLTGLIEKDARQSVRFVSELSKVYRYLLQSNEKELIALKEEIQFTEAYFFLLQMRFGEGISLNLENVHNSDRYLIPPLTLQMLVENALKHNRVSSKSPLEVVIRTENEDWLVVQNNLQPKRHTASTGVGLANIAAKLRLLNKPELEVHKSATHFTIKVPLIKA